MRISILAMRFLCELGLLGGLAYAGWVLGDGGVSSWIFAIGAPLIAAVIWGTFVSPKAKVKPPPAVRLVIEIDLYTAAAVALWFADAPVAGVVLAVFGISTSVLNLLTEQAFGSA